MSQARLGLKDSVAVARFPGAQQIDQCVFPSQITSSRVASLVKMQFEKLSVGLVAALSSASLAAPVAADGGDNTEV